MFADKQIINKSQDCADDQDISEFNFEFDIIQEPCSDTKKKLFEDISTDEEHEENKFEIDKFEFVEKIIQNRPKIYKALKRPALKALSKKLSFEQLSLIRLSTYVCFFNVKNLNNIKIQISKFQNMDDNQNNFKLVCPGNKDHIFFREELYLDHMKTCSFVKTFDSVYMCGYFPQHFLRSKKKKDTHEVDCPYKLINSYKKIDEPQKNPYFQKKKKKVENKKYYVKKNYAKIKEQDIIDQNKEINCNLTQDKQQNKKEKQIKKKLEFLFNENRLLSFQYASYEVFITLDDSSELMFLCENYKIKNEKLCFYQAQELGNFQLQENQFLFLIYPGKKNDYFKYLLAQEQKVLYINKDPDSMYFFLQFDPKDSSFKIYKLSDQIFETDSIDQKLFKVLEEYKKIKQELSNIQILIKQEEKNFDNINKQVFELQRIKNHKNISLEIQIKNAEQIYTIEEKKFQQKKNKLSLKQKVLQRLKVNARNLKKCFKNQLKILQEENDQVKKNILICKKLEEKVELIKEEILQQTTIQTNLNKNDLHQQKKDTSKKTQRIKNKARKGVNSKINTINMHDKSKSDFESDENMLKYNIKFDTIKQQNVQQLQKCIICNMNSRDIIVIPCMCIKFCQNCFESSLITNHCVSCLNIYSDFAVMNSESIQQQFNKYQNNQSQKQN